MAHWKTRNVNTAFYTLVDAIHRKELPVRNTNSRNGNVIVIDEPMTITYLNPLERVLLNPVRDVNPFSLLYESLYMLTGRNDVAPLAYYTKKFQEYSDDGVTLNGSYGYRWRNAVTWEFDRDIDQLQIIIDHLRNNPESRRAVLSMWNVEDDLLKIDTSKDVACNLNVMFSIRKELGVKTIKERGVPTYCDGPHLKDNCPNCVRDKSYLDMTVTNRSNDMIWGALGANYVTFSVLLEYMAAHLGVNVGKYNQFSNNLHVYEWNWKPTEWLKAEEEYDRHTGDPYEDDDFNHYPLVKNPEVFDKEVVDFVEQNAHYETPTNRFDDWTEPFLQEVAQPMCYAFHNYKQKDFGTALQWCEDTKAKDWQIVCRNWLQRRVEKHATK